MRSACLTILIVFSCLVVRGEAAETSPIPTPVLRHGNYLAIRAPRGANLHCDVAPVAAGNRIYRDLLKVRLLRPDGIVAASQHVRPAESVRLSAAVDWDGLCALESLSGSTLVRVHVPEETPHAYWCGVGHPLITVGAWGPLYFHVPAGTREFTLALRADVTREGLVYTVRDPHGKMVAQDEGDFDERTEIAIAVPENKDDGTWSLEISKPGRKGLYLDDVSVELGSQVPPFLAPRPEWVALFATEARSEPKTNRTRSRPADTQPTVEPFRGVSDTRIDRALSRDVDKHWTTTLPVTYILDYGRDHLGNADYVPTVATAPPTLLHLGKDVPLNHGWGPIKALGGENQAYGTEEDIVRLSPAEVEERIAGLRQMVADLHAGGVRWVTPYVCAMTVNGDPERRTGFWEFYDHWDDYRALGLAPKPAADPLDWLQRSADGRPYFYYRYAYPDEYYPAFKTNHRFAACWRSEGWRTWLCEVVRFSAKCDCDGVFVDNGRSQRCQCPRCLQAFQAYLQEHYSSAQAKTLFGFDSFADAAFPEKGDTLLEAELNRFWCTTTREQLATLKSLGTKELGQEFIVFPNGGDPKAIQRAMPDADFVMFEKSFGDYGTNPGLVVSPLFEGVSSRVYNDNIFEHKIVQCFRQRVKPVILTRAGYPSQPPERFMNADAARLGMAECGAFSGGGAFLIRPYFGIYHDALNEYRRFFETHPQLYAGLETYAPTAVLAFLEQQWLGNAPHVGTVQTLTDRLTSEHVLFDFVSEFRLQESALDRYDSVVAADLHVVSQGQLRELAAYVSHGGHLIVVGDFAVQDEFLRDRPAESSPLLARIAGKRGETVRHGDGRVTSVASVESVPAALGGTAPVLACADALLGAQVKVNAFQSIAEVPPRIVLHLVNYNVPLGVDAPPPAAVDGIELLVPVPKGMRAVSARALAPDRDGDTALAINGAESGARIAVPGLRIYQVVELKIGRAHV